MAHARHDVVCMAQRRRVGPSERRATPVLAELRSAGTQRRCSGAQHGTAPCSDLAPCRRRCSDRQVHGQTPRDCAAQAEAPARAAGESTAARRTAGCGAPASLISTQPPCFTIRCNCSVHNHLSCSSIRRGACRRKWTFSAAGVPCLAHARCRGPVAARDLISRPETEWRSMHRICKVWFCVPAATYAEHRKRGQPSQMCTLASAGIARPLVPTTVSLAPARKRSMMLLPPPCDMGDPLAFVDLARSAEVRAHLRCACNAISFWALQDLVSRRYFKATWVPLSR